MRSLYSGVSGLKNFQTSMDVIGNNIANVSTNGFKSSTVTFADTISQTISGGTASTSSTGGTNSVQVGLGAQINTIKNNFKQGELGSTGNSSDLALEGEGFFVVSDGASNYYSRDGSFDIADDYSLSNASGYRVQGWTADQTGFINTATAPGNISIKLGADLVAQATQNVVMAGNLNSSGTIATAGTTALSGKLYSAASTDAQASTLLTGLTDSLGASYGLNVGSVITMNFSKGSTSATPLTFTVAAGSTVQDLMTAMQNKMGLDTSSFSSSQGAGVTMTGGQIQVKGNYGTSNSLTDFTVSAKNASATALTAFDDAIAPDAANGFTQSVAANGESTTSTIKIYDSLGNAHTVTAYFTKTANNQWTWNAECPDSATSSTRMGGGVINFTSTGEYSSDAAAMSLPLTNGADTPLVYDFDFKNIKQLATSTSMNVSSQDGFASGTLKTYSVGTNGIITGTYTNGMTQRLGQLATAMFSNEEGLMKEGSNLFAQSTNSGVAQIGTAGQNGSGKISAGYLELSNVDLAGEFTSMITTQRAFQACSKVISTADQMLQELVNLKQ